MDFTTLTSVQPFLIRPLWSNWTFHLNRCKMQYKYLQVSYICLPLYLPPMHVTFCRGRNALVTVPNIGVLLICEHSSSTRMWTLSIFNSLSKQKAVFLMNTLFTPLNPPLPNCSIWLLFSLLHLHFIVRLPNSRLFRLQVEPNRVFTRWVDFCDGSLE